MPQPLNNFQQYSSDHFDGKHFYNPWNPKVLGTWATLKWYLTRRPQAWPQPQELDLFDMPPQYVDGQRLRLAYVGHSTMLLQTRGLNILFDPIWSERASPFSFGRPRRVHLPGIRFADLPAVDVVLISHNHYDHLDLPTIQRLWQRDQPRIIVPLGNEKILSKAIPGLQVEAYDWGGGGDLGNGLSFCLEPCQHWSCRNFFDRNQALWASFVLSSLEGCIYLVGDTGYEARLFQAAKEKYGAFRLAVLPIGSSDPRWFMGYNHMHAEEAVLACRDLGFPFTVPSHYGVFQLADTGHDAPLHSLVAALRAQGLPEDCFHPLVPGGHCWLD